MAEFFTSTGVKAVVNPASFKEAMSLKSAVLKEISKTDFDLKSGSLKTEDIDVAELAKIIMNVDASEAVYKALFDCLARCTYDGHKITEATFEKIEARKDYYEICIACLKENLLPFFEGLYSKLQPFLSKLAVQAENTQK